jgi:hypothetical protein
MSSAVGRLVYAFLKTKEATSSDSPADIAGYFLAFAVREDSSVDFTAAQEAFDRLTLNITKIGNKPFNGHYMSQGVSDLYRWLGVAHAKGDRPVP